MRSGERVIMKALKNCIVIVLLAILLITAAAGCSVQKEADENTGSDKNDTLYFTDQTVRESPEWVTDLDAFVIPQVINAGVIGMLLCAVYLRSGNLIPVMVLHTLNDLGKFLFVDVVAEGGLVTEEITFSSSDLIFLVVSMVVYLGIALYLVRPSKRAEIRAIWDRKWNEKKMQ